MHLLYQVDKLKAIDWLPSRLRATVQTFEEKAGQSREDDERGPKAGKLVGLKKTKDIGAKIR
jgi:hypothetical protein